MDKSPEAFRTISEVADSLELPQHVLRFWESKFSQLRPLKRGGGRRYYRPEDIDLLRGIRHLLYDEGYTIRGVQKILKEQGARHVTSLSQLDGEHVKPESVPDPIVQEKLDPVIHAPAQTKQSKAADIIPAEERADGSAGPANNDPAKLSKEDIAQLENTLYELSEIRRLLKDTRED